VKSEEFEWERGNGVNKEKKEGSWICLLLNAPGNETTPLSLESSLFSTHFRSKSLKCRKLKVYNIIMFAQGFKI
jgi:hypothetical protein